MPCHEGIEIGWVIWDLDQIPAKGIEQVKEWYAEFPVKASACVECGVCKIVCPYDNFDWRYPRGGYGVRYKYG